MPRRGRRLRLAKHISKDQSGYSVRIERRGPPIERRFPLSTPFETVKQWRDDELRRREDLAAAGEDAPGDFAADAQKYLAAVRAMSEYAQRARDIEIWCARFKGRRRDSIQPLDIRTARDEWLTVGPKLVQRRVRGERRWVPLPKPLSASTVNKRLRALENLWTVLDGRKAYNPVREVPEPQEPDAAPRGLSYAVVERILDQMRPSQTRVRLRVMAYTGLAQVEIAGLARADVDLEAGTVLVRRRRKGRGGKMAPPALHPLTPEGVEAFREFRRENCWGEFSRSSMWKAFQLAARAAGYTGLRPYDFRHSYGTAVFRSTGDLAATQGMLRQRSGVTTLRYVAAAIAPRARLAADAFARQVAADRAEAKPGTAAGRTAKS
jgi:integrase